LITSLNDISKSAQIYSFVTLLTIAIFAGYIMITFGFGLYIFPILIPDMRSTYLFSYSAIGTVLALNQVAYIGFSFIGGWLSLIMSSTKLIQSAVITSSVCLILMGVVDRFWIIGCLLVITGASAAVSWVPIVNIVNKMVPDKHLCRSLGFISSGTSYGIFITGFVVSFIVNNYNWKAVYITFGVFSLVLLIASKLFFILTRSLEISECELETKKIYRDKANEAVVCDKGKITLLTLIMFLTGISFIPFQTYLIPFLREELGYSLELSGYIWNIIGFLGMISGLIIGTIADKISIRQTLLLIYMLVFSSAAILSFTPYIWAVFLTALLFGTAYFGMFGLIPAYVSKVISKKHSGFYFGICNLALGLGSALGNYFAGLSQQLTSSFRGQHIAICFVCFCLFLIAALELEKDRKE
jgi:predicted MFS family arabinose efflux permease